MLLAVELSQDPYGTDSSHGGNIKCVPSSSTFSSVANPGGLVAISKSTPPGSRKYTE